MRLKVSVISLGEGIEGGGLFSGSGLVAHADSEGGGAWPFGGGGWGLGGWTRAERSWRGQEGGSGGVQGAPVIFMFWKDPLAKDKGVWTGVGAVEIVRWARVWERFKVELVLHAD